MRSSVSGRGARALVAGLLGSTALGIAPAGALTIDLENVSTPFNTFVGIDYFEPQNDLAVTVFYPNGSPHNFNTIAPNGTQSQFSTTSGITDEIKIATARSAAHGGFAGSPFAAGTLFAGNGVDGQIMKVAPNGAVTSVFADLPGAGNGLMRGSLYVDRTGEWGGNLIAATTNGQVWQIDGAGAATNVGNTSSITHLEGLMTVPNDPLRYGGLAGKIIAGDEQNSKLWAFGPGGSVQSWVIAAAIEDLDLIMPNENLFGVNFGSGRLLGANASQFASNVGDILLTQESVPGSGLALLKWDFVNNRPLVETITLGSSPVLGSWEHVTFAPNGVLEIESADPLPEYKLTVDSGPSQTVTPLEGPANQSAVAKYRYNIENSSSSNSGLEQPDLGLVYLFNDFQNKLSLFFQLDKAGDNDGGNLCLSATSTGVAGNGGNVTVQDDPTVSGDSYWNAGTGTGQFCWAWPAGQTDGAVITMPYPEFDTEWSITFTVDSISGLELAFRNSDGTLIDLNEAGSFTIGALAAAPEPALAPALLGMLGVLGFGAWRRRA